MNVDGFTWLLGVTAIASMVGIWVLTRPSKGGPRAKTRIEGQLRRNPNDAASRLELGKVKLLRGDHSEAVSDLQIACELMPKSAPAHHFLGLALLASGNATGAVVHFEKSIQLQPYFAEAIVGLGSALEAKGDLHGAQEAFDRATRTDRGAAAPYMGLARVYCRRGDTSQALTALKEAISRDPSRKGEAKETNDFDSLLGHADFRALVF